MIVNTCNCNQISYVHTHSWHGHALITSGFTEISNKVKLSFPPPDCCICLIIFFTRRSEGKFSSSDNRNGHTGAP